MKNHSWIHFFAHAIQYANDVYNCDKGGTGREERFSLSFLSWFWAALCQNQDQAFLLLARSQTVSELGSRWSRGLGPDQEVKERKNEKAQKDVNENLLGEPKAEKLEVFNLYVENLIDCRVSSVIRKGLGRKLNHRQSAHTDQADVEQERAHVGLSKHHWMELDKGDP